jgi:hypothetical protein
VRVVLYVYVHLYVYGIMIRTVNLLHVGAGWVECLFARVHNRRPEWD